MKWRPAVTHHRIYFKDDGAAHACGRAGHVPHVRHACVLGYELHAVGSKASQIAPHPHTRPIDAYNSNRSFLPIVFCTSINQWALITQIIVLLNPAGMRE
jgi:hypothetical protein